MVDIARTPPNRTKRRIVYGALGLVALALVVFGVRAVEPAAPPVEESTLWIDTVRRGSFVREVRGTGTLVPESIRWIAAPSDGRVEELRVQPGAEVTADTVLLSLSNPELEASAREADLQLRAAEADLAALRVRLDHDVLDQEAQAAGIVASHEQARLEAEANEELAKDGLVSTLQLKISRVRVEELATRRQLEERRLKSAEASLAAQLSAQEARVGQLRELAALRREQVGRLLVRSGISGVLQALPVEPGQQVASGSVLARVAQPDRLKGELRIAETQARDVRVGLSAKIDTRNGVVEARVARVDPAAVNGTVAVDLTPLAPLPRGARPDLSIDGTIELERVEDVLHVGRPAFGQPESTVGLFRVDPRGGAAVRIPVKLGRSSVHVVEVVEGLAEGDRVVLSDLSTWDAYDRIRLR